MTSHDDFDRTLAGWLEAEALAPAPSGGLDEVVDATSRRRPRPAWLAGPGSLWVRAVPGVGSDFAVRTIPRLGRRWSTVLIVLLAIAAILGGVLLVGARLIQPSPPLIGRLGHLAYGIDGSIYVADWDGGNPVRIADGVLGLDTGSNECGTFRGEGRMWSADGRHLAYRGDSCPTGESMVYVSDPEGHVVASFPGTGWLVSWSPDSTRIATWVDLFKTIGIYGLEGERQALLTVPPRCALPGDFDPVWSPDGTSVIVWPCKIPLDGSKPERLPASDPRSHEQWAYSPDGTRAAWVDLGSLIVGAADGSKDTVLIPAGVTMGGLIPKWAPTGDRIAFDAGPPDEIRVVDVASGKVTRLASVGGDGPSHVLSLSPEGDRVLFWQGDATGATSLWTVRVDGKDTQLVASGTDWGDWQKQPAPTSAASPTVTMTP